MGIPFLLPPTVKDAFTNIFRGALYISRVSLEPTSYLRRSSPGGNRREDVPEQPHIRPIGPIHTVGEGYRPKSWVGRELVQKLIHDLHQQRPEYSDSYLAGGCRHKAGRLVSPDRLHDGTLSPHSLSLDRQGSPEAGQLECVCEFLLPALIFFYLAVPFMGGDRSIRGLSAFPFRRQVKNSSFQSHPLYHLSQKTLPTQPIHPT